MIAPDARIGKGNGWRLEGRSLRSKTGAITDSLMES
jgi:hypothetical protein